MAMKFTASQTAAIETKDKNILVSASAGSGKTRVLVERVTQQLLAGADIDRFLIVTFTEAAAAEMKDRLEGALLAQLANSTGKQQQHLRRQLRLLKVANISTLHAFALRLIEQYHYAINLDPQFRLADDAESTLLKLEVYQMTLNQAYEDDANGVFKDFVSQFATSGQDDQPLQDAVFKMFNFAMARPDTDEWLAALTEKYDFTGDFSQSTFYKEALQPQVIEKLDSLILRNEVLQNEASIDSEDPGIMNRFDNLVGDGKVLEYVREQISHANSWDQLVKAVREQVFDGWGKRDGKGKNLKKDTDPEVKNAWAEVKEQRDDILKEFEAMKVAYFLLDSAGLAFTLSGASSVLRQLIDFVQVFRKNFLTEKLRRKVLDFNDLEHFALEIVQRQEIADDLRQQYVQIMVDEYQDTNQLQEAILQSFVQSDNVFQVGDIKQSIYKFRQADPALFRQKLSAYPALQNSEVITLQENFRSRPNVTNFINYLFEQLMSEDLGDVNYQGAHELVAGADYYPDELEKHAELLVYLNEQSDEDESEIVDGTSANGYTATTGQIMMMGHKIKDLMASQMLIYDRELQVKRPLKFSDITILVPARGQNLDVLAIFRELEIPIMISAAENYFQTMEISIMLSLLQVIDNPLQDIPLVAVLRSPIYNLGENALAFIRAQKLDGNFFEALKTTVASDQVLLATDSMALEEIEKVITTVKQFFVDLERFRMLAVQNQIVALIWDIYTQTGWLDYVGGLPAGEQRQANLHALYERAAAYQRTSFVGLYQFINYVQQIQAQDKDLGAADANVVSDAVQLMTIHHSKGLEFPVVFMLNTSRRMISNQDTAGAIALDGEAGAGIDYIDVEHNLKLPTPQRENVREAIRRGAFAEQLRVLYVALTRAEQHIYLVGTYKSAETMWKKWSQAKFGSQRMLPDWVRLKGSSYLDLAGMALLRHPDVSQKLADLVDVDLTEFTVQPPKVAFDFDINFSTEQQLNDWQGSSTTEKVTEEQVALPVSQSKIDDWQTILNFEYPYETATRATNYQSVSELKRLFEDPDIVDGQRGLDRRLVGDDLAGLRFTATELPEPEFLQIDDGKVAPAAVGTATHLIMQRIDLAQTGDLKTIIDQVVSTLVDNGMIEPAVAEHVNLTQIEYFFTESSLGKMMQQQADTLQREVPFSLLFEADRLYREINGSERVLVHGIMDGYFEVGDETWLFDYKTDFIMPNESAADVLSKRYGGQLRVYNQALIAMGKTNVRSFIYSFAKNEVIEL